MKSLKYKICKYMMDHKRYDLAKKLMPKTFDQVYIDTITRALRATYIDAMDQLAEEVEDTLNGGSNSGVTRV